MKRKYYIDLGSLEMTVNGDLSSEELYNKAIDRLKYAIKNGDIEIVNLEPMD